MFKDIYSYYNNDKRDLISTKLKRGKLTPQKNLGQKSEEFLINLPPK